MAAEEGPKIHDLLPSTEEQLLQSPRSPDCQMDDARIVEDAGTSRKRTMNEVVTVIPEPEQTPPAPTSFTSQLTGGDENEYFSETVKEQNDHIDQLITTHATQLRKTVGEIQQAQYFLLALDAEEKASKRIRAKDLELHELHCKYSDLETKELISRSENQALQNRLKFLEQQAESLRAQLEEGKGEHEVVAESTQVDQEKVEAGTLTCMVCRNKKADLVLLPCGHSATRKSIEECLSACGVCDIAKTSGNAQVSHHP